LAPIPTSRWPLVHTLLLLLARGRLPLRMLQALLHPAAARARVERLGGELRTIGELPPSASSADRLAAVEQLFLGQTAQILFSMIPVFGAGMAAYALAGRL